MAQIQIKALGKNNPVNLNIRFYHNTINCYAKSNIFLDKLLWSNKTNSLKQRIEESTRKNITDKIDSLSGFIFNKFRSDFAKGEKIDSKWLNKQINDFYEKPDNDNDLKYYFIPFIEKYIKESPTRINPKKNKLISTRTIQNYKTTLSKIIDFEKKTEKRLRTKDINLEFHKYFTYYLSNDRKYNGTVIEKYISHIKQFVKEAKIEGIETSVEVQSKNFTFQRNKPIDTYLNVDEITKIFNLNLTENTELKDSKDLLIIGLWTGLRLGDLTRFGEFKIVNDRIIIVETDKAGEDATIPLHQQVKNVLDSRSGIFPKIGEVKFNRDIKKICELAGINEIIVGSKRIPVINRKVKDYYPKYELISSHICRRSFVSNHYGKIDDRTIMAITGHKSHNQFMKYVKTTDIEYANKMENHWKNN